MKRLHITATSIKRMRAALGLTQDELGRAIGSTGSTVANWETGRKPSKKLKAKLYDYFDSRRSEVKDSDSSHGSENTRVRAGYTAQLDSSVDVDLIVRASQANQKTKRILGAICQG